MNDNWSVHAPIGSEFLPVVFMKEAARSEMFFTADYVTLRVANDAVYAWKVDTLSARRVQEVILQDVLRERLTMNSRRCLVCDSAYSNVEMSGARPSSTRPSSTRPESHDGGSNDASINHLPPERHEMRR